MTYVLVIKHADLVNHDELEVQHFIVSDLDNICPATLLHDSKTLVEVFGILGTRAGEVVSAQQAADVPQVLARVIHFTLVLRSFGTSLIIYDEI